MSIIDLSTALFFSVIVFVSGLLFSSSGSSIKSFFAAGGAVPWWIAGLSLFMSFFSVGTFVVWGSIAYADGLVAVTIQMMICLAGFAVGAIIAPVWNKTGAITAAEFIASRLGFRVQKIYTYLFLFISLFTAGAFLYPVGKIIEVSTGLPLEISIIALGLCIIIYTTVGGLWAVLVTDVLQFIVLFAAVIIVLPLAFAEVDGISGFISQAPEGFFALTNKQYSWVFMFAFGLYNAIYIGGNWAYVQRYTSVSNPANAKKVGFLFGALYIVSPLIWMLPPMIYKVMHPDLQGLANEGAYLMLCKEVLPQGLLGLILGAMVFATASSVNTTLNISAGIFTNDLWRYFRPSSNEREQMLIARVATGVFGVLALCVAISVQSMGGIVEVVLSVAAITGGAMFLPPIWALFSKQQTGFSVLSTTIISLLVNLCLKFITPVLWELSLSRSMEMLVGVFVPILILVGFEALYSLRKTTNQQYLDYRVSRPKESVQAIAEAKLSAENSNQHGRRVIAGGAFCISLMLVMLGFIADKGGVLIAVIGVAVAIISVTILPRKQSASLVS